jgi:hypothetical protein
LLYLALQWVVKTTQGALMPMPHDHNSKNGH